MSLHRLRVVLVRTHYAGNLGAAARAMRNLGVADLALVAPVADPADREARRLSTHGEPLLDAARVVPTLADAVADCGLVVATSANAAGLFRHQTSGPPERIVPRLLDALDGGPAALVFGPEPSGLTNAEVSACQYLVHIPADESYPALNLAQSVAVCLYETRKQWLARTAPAGPPEPPASFAELDRVFGRLREALEAVHFLYGPKADPLMHAVRHLIGRARPTAAEVKLLYGLARQLLWVAERAKKGGGADG